MSVKISEMMKSARSQRVKGDEKPQNISMSHRCKIQSAENVDIARHLDQEDKIGSGPVSIEKGKSIE